MIYWKVKEFEKKFKSNTSTTVFIDELSGVISTGFGV